MVPSALENAFKDQIAKAAAEGIWTEQQTERILLAAARVGQHVFALNVLANCGGRCVFCGLNPGPFGGKRRLVAGHIKPWKDSTSAERLNLRNGLAACPSHDVAFDTSLLTVDASFRVRVSARWPKRSAPILLPGSTTGARRCATRSCSRHRPSCPAAIASTGIRPTSSLPDRGLYGQLVGPALALLGDHGEIRLHHGPTAGHRDRVLIRREAERDADVIRAITTAAFARDRPPNQIPPEAGLIDELRASPAWFPALSLVAVTPQAKRSAKS